jgi:hypothetical protein
VDGTPRSTERNAEDTDSMPVWVTFDVSHHPYPTVRWVTDLPSFVGNDHHAVKVQFAIRTITLRMTSSHFIPRPSSCSHPSRLAATLSALSDAVMIELGVMHTSNVCPHRLTPWEPGTSGELRDDDDVSGYRILRAIGILNLVQRILAYVRVRRSVGFQTQGYPMLFGRTEPVFQVTLPRQIRNQKPRCLS